MADIRTSDHGSLIGFIADTDAGREWIAEYLPADAPTLGNMVCVETRYAGDIIDGMIADGLEVVDR